MSDADQQRFAHINLVRDEPVRVGPGDGFVTKLDSAYLPLAQAQWETRSRYGNTPQEQAIGRAAWNSPGLAFFRWFAEQPVFDGATEEGRCAWFVDLRLGSPGRDWLPFQFGACRDGPTAPWHTYERRAGGKAAVD